jgi:hypothetical protein
MPREFAAADDRLGWFEALYREANGDASLIPWADLRGNPLWPSSSGQNSGVLRPIAAIPHSAIECVRQPEVVLEVFHEV